MHSAQAIPAVFKRYRSDEVFDCFARSLRRRHGLMWPYAYALLERVFPDRTVHDLVRLPWPALDLDGVSGTREIHNDQRQYFDVATVADIGVAFDVAEAFQCRGMIRLLREELGVDLSGTFLRVEYCQDVDGFWLEPHTDIGVKKLTLQCYLGSDPAHQDLGTDIYSAPQEHVARAPFGKNKAMIFVPNDHSWHGFAQRPIRGIRRSLIVNYVTKEWRQREQLAFPDEPVSAL